MREILASVLSLLVAIGLLMLGTGLFNTFVGLRTAIEGFPGEATGLMMSAYYCGLVLGTMYCGRLVNSVGHIRAFTAFCSIFSAAVLLFPLFISVPVWAALRALNGFCLAGTVMVTESWLNARATGKTRGTVLSLYMMTTYLAVGTGQLLINLGDLRDTLLFLITGILLSLALVPVAITRATLPAPVAASHFRFRKLYAISPVAVIGCLVSGLCLGALFGMAPIFGHELGMSVGRISQFMSALILSGLLMQLPVGRLSDRFDRRTIIIWVAATATLSAMGVVLVTAVGTFDMPVPGGVATLLSAHSMSALMIMVALYGGVSATVYPLCVAYANDYVDPADMVQVSAGLVLAYGIGAAIGPLGAASFMRIAGPPGLFFFCALVSVLLLVFAIYRTRRRHWAAVGGKESFRALPEATSSHLVLELDPRAPGTQLTLDLVFPDETTAESDHRPH